MSSKILLVEDDFRIRHLLKTYLHKEGFEVVEVDNGIDALDKFKSEKIDLIILDIMIPGINGYEVCRLIRNNSDVIIIMLTAKGEEDDKLLGYELGADDYITKPFSPKVLVAKVNVLLKRTKNLSIINEGIIKIGDLEINELSHDVFVEGEKIYLSPREFDLLLYLAQNKGIVLSRDIILNNVWGYTYDGDARTVDTHIKRLRKKIEGSRKFISTVKRSGYKLEVQK